MAGLVGSWAFAGSGWLLTLFGTGLAAFTLWQVVRRSSSFRRALTMSTRRSSAEEFQAAAEELEQLAKNLGKTRKVPEVRAIASKWSPASARAIAALESVSSDNPLSLSDRELTRWRTREGRQWNVAVRAKSASARIEKNNPNPAEDLRVLLRHSQECASSVARKVTPSTTARFAEVVSLTSSQMAYILPRIRTARDDDLHDE